MSIRRNTAISCTILGVCFSAIVTPSVFAKNEATEETVEEIFVQGKRRAYQGNFDILETPSVSQSIGEELLLEVGASSLAQALDLSASVAQQNNFGGQWNSFSVRGFSGDINLPSGFLVNGFNAGRGYGGPRDLAGIETVEVLKGPRSAVFGRGEPGGTVNLVTKRPKFKTKGYVRSTVGSWDQMRLEADAETTFGADDQVGIRLVGFYEDSDSFRETVETKRFGFYPSITWNISADTNITYELEYTRQDIPFDRGVAFTEQFGFTPRETFVGEPGDGPIATEVVGHQLEIQHNFNENWSILGGLGYRETSLKGDASETNFGGRQTLVADGRTLSRFFRSRDFDSKYFVARAELAGEFETGSFRHRLLIGADYDRFDNSLFILRFRPSGGISSDTDISTLDPAEYLLLDVFNPVYGQHPQPVPGPNTDRNEVFVGTGIYIQDQIDITDKLQFRLGGRFDYFEQDLTNLRANPASTVSFSATRFSPQVGAVYLVNDGFSLYASYGEGFRQQTGSDFEGNQFAPNITKSTELGFKVDLASYLDAVTGIVTFTLFHVDQSNILVNDDRPAAVDAGFFSFPAGEARSRGIELDANVDFDSGFGLWLSYAYTGAEFTNSNPDADFGARINAGDSLINSPKHQLNIQASQTFNIAEMPVRLGGGFLYTSERLGWTGFDFFLPDYITARVFAEIQPIDGLSVRLDVDNLFDETFYVSSYADVWVNPGSPRRFRISASYAF